MESEDIQKEEEKQQNEIMKYGECGERRRDGEEKVWMRKGKGHSPDIGVEYKESNCVLNSRSCTPETIASNSLSSRQ